MLEPAARASCVELRLRSCAGDRVQVEQSRRDQDVSAASCGSFCVRRLLSALLGGGDERGREREAFGAEQFGSASGEVAEDKIAEGDGRPGAFDAKRGFGHAAVAFEPAARAGCVGLRLRSCAGDRVQVEQGRLDQDVSAAFCNSFRVRRLLSVLLGGGDERGREREAFGAEQFGGASGEVAEDDVCSGAFDAKQGFGHAAVAFEPAARAGCVGLRLRSCAGDRVQVEQGRFDQDVRGLLHIEFDRAQRLFLRAEASFGALRG